MLDLASILDYNIHMNWKRIQREVEAARWRWCCTTKLGRKWSKLNKQDKFVAKLFLVQAICMSTITILRFA
jgi:hypothetical protein